MIYTEPKRWDCDECGGVGSSPSHRPGCVYIGAGRLATSRAVAAMRQELRIAEHMAVEADGTYRWRDLAEALLENVRQMLTAIDQAAMGHPHWIGRAS
jgi:hypothetical protein